MTNAALDVVLPVHNEAPSIEAVLQELYRELSGRLPVRIIVSEDGSTDGTPDILCRMKERFPMHVITGPRRKGYSRAVIDALAAANAPYVVALDSDGQCDPADFWPFWERRSQFDVLIGRRSPRRDPWLRLLCSKAFYLIYRLLFPVPVHDPSCPYVLISQKAIARVLPHLGTLDQGFWWEFIARCYHHGFRIGELPVRHRVRTHGASQIYRARSLPRIALSHLSGLISIWRQTHR